MNIDDDKPYVHYIHKKFVMTPEAIEDRDRYNVTSSKDFHDELVEYAWHPSRHQDWCLTTDEVDGMSHWKQDLTPVI
jgi:hypothetical protein